MYQGMQARSVGGPSTEVLCSTPGCGEVVYLLRPNESVRTSSSTDGLTGRVRATCPKCGKEHRLDVAVQP